MKKFFPLVLVIALTSSVGTPVAAYGLYGDENPLVEAMLRMMELFGLIDRGRVPWTVGNLGGYGQTPLMLSGAAPGIGGYPGSTPFPGFGGYPGPTPMTGLGGFPGATAPYSGANMAGATWPGSAWYPPGAGPSAPNLLDGIWELNNGGLVVIRGSNARLYVSRDKYQNFQLAYDQQHLWWKPLGRGTYSRYRYQMRNGRVVLRDSRGNYLLMRRRR